MRVLVVEVLKPVFLDRPKAGTAWEDPFDQSISWPKLALEEPRLGAVEGREEAPRLRLLSDLCSVAASSALSIRSGRPSSSTACLISDRSSKGDLGG